MSGSQLGGAGSLITSIASLFGTNSTGSTTGSGYANLQGQAQSVTNASQTSKTTGTTTTTPLANPIYLAMASQLAQSALQNAENPTAATSGVISGIFQAAKDSFASVFGQQGSSGLYNSSTAGVEEDATYARATADAASSVLSFMTGEQGVAQNAISSLLQYTTGQQQNTSSETDTSATSTTQQTNSTEQQQGTHSVTKQSSGYGSVVCGWMFQNSYLSARKYVTVTKHFHKTYSRWGQNSYYFWGTKLVKYLQKDETSWQSNVIFWIFWHRTEYVCASAGLRECHKSLKGLFAKKLVYTMCFPVGVSMFVKDKVMAFFGAQVPSRQG